jgi:hypothetical protein
MAQLLQGLEEPAARPATALPQLKDPVPPTVMTAVPATPVPVAVPLTLSDTLLEPVVSPRTSVELFKPVVLLGVNEI